MRERIRGARGRYRSARYRLRERLSPTSVSSADVAAALTDCGLGPGDTCFMQAAMSAFGSFEEGPRTVLQGLDRVLGERGLVAMPVYPLAAIAYEYLAGDPVFDARTTPSRMGAISEAFRRADGTVRSVHPTHSVSARGPGAAELVAGHDADPCPFGTESPFARIVRRNPLQVFFGCGTGPMTIYHVFECTCEPPFPYDVFADRVFDSRCVDAEGRELTVPTLVHDPRLAPVRIDASPRLQARFRDAMAARGGVAVPLGRGEILAIRMEPLFHAFEDLLAEGVTLYERVPSTRMPSVPPQDRVGG